MRVYIDMDGVLCDFDGAKAAKLRQNPSMPYPQSQYGFYISLQPLPGALKSVETLFAHPQLEPWILTAPSIHNPLCYTEKRIWVEQHLGFKFAERLIISPDKSLLIGDVLVDDNCQGHGQERFEGLLIHFGSEDYPDWQAVMDYLLME